MANTPENLAEARKKAYLSPRIGKHGKAKKTIAKEEARKFYLEKILKGFFDKLTDVQLKAVLQPQNSKERMYVIDQVVGKPKEMLLIEEKKTIDVNIKATIKKIYGKEYETNRRIIVESI